MVASRSQSRPPRPNTHFFPAAPKITNVTPPETNVSKGQPPSEKKDRHKPTARSNGDRPDRASAGDHRTRSSVPIFPEDPWADYGKGIEIFPKRRTFLCQHRRNRLDLVHIQQLDAGAVTESLTRTVSRHSHPSFLRLLCCYHHEGSTFLVWEPVELSLAQVIGSKWSVREAELVSIVWPVSPEGQFLPLEDGRRGAYTDALQVIQGIRHLRDANRALASLTYENIFLTDSGNVKIADVDRSCEIDAAAIYAATLKLEALSNIIKGLRQQMSPLAPWSPQAEDLPAQLMTTPLDDLWRNGVFAQLNEGDLRMLVNVLSKVSHYDVRFS